MSGNVLEEARERINETDRKMAELFEERMQAVSRIAAYKRETGLPIADRSREKEILERTREYVRDPAFRPDYERFLQSVLEISRDYQKRQKNESGEDAE